MPDSAVFASGAIVGAIIGCLGTIGGVAYGMIQKHGKIVKWW